MRQAKRWLAFAASPCFALMMAMSAAHGSDPAAVICSSMPGGSPGGMTLMYALMSLFHATPWLGLISIRLSTDPRGSRAGSDVQGT